MRPSKARRLMVLNTKKGSCEDCVLNTSCLGVGLSAQELEGLNEIVERRISLGRNEPLYRMGARFRSVYVIRTGSLKTYALTDRGSEQITGFYLPSEVVGLDSFNQQYHPSAAEALETTTLCEIPYRLLMYASASFPGLQRRLIHLMSREVLHGTQHMALLGKKTAGARLATLLLRLSERFRQRGLPPDELFLSMSRCDIGNHLGLSTETISRLFTSFQNFGLIAVNRKLIRLRDIGSLRHIAGDCREGNRVQARF